MTDVQERLGRVTVLKAGSHSPPNGELTACVMEAVAYVAGEPWSDHPACASPVMVSATPVPVTAMSKGFSSASLLAM